MVGLAGAGHVAVICDGGCGDSSGTGVPVSRLASSLPSSAVTATSPLSLEFESERAPPFPSRTNVPRYEEDSVDDGGSEPDCRCCCCENEIGSCNSKVFRGSALPVGICNGRIYCCGIGMNRCDPRVHVAYDSFGTPGTMPADLKSRPSVCRLQIDWYWSVVCDRPQWYYLLSAFSFFFSASSILWSADDLLLLLF